MAVGKVYLIGAGPGDPGLLTLRGKQCLERAEVVLYDYLSGPRLLKYTRPGAQLYCLGRHGQGKIWSQDEICERIVAEALAGRSVARLKGGDPSIFGRMAEEIDALKAAGVPFEIVPGVTTATAAGAYAGVTITDRDHASCVAFITGHLQASKSADETGQRVLGLDFAALAQFPGTLVMYMGVTNAELWSQALIANGKPADTPVLLVRRCTLPDQSSVSCTLATVAEVLAPGKVRPPLVAIIGPVASDADTASWFTSRPLFGQTVLVTRPRDQAAPMVEQLQDLGAEVLLQPAIEIGPPKDWALVDQAIDRLGEFDWVVFSSRNGVAVFLDRLSTAGKDSRAFGSAKIAAIGPATADALAEHSLKSDLQPCEYRAEALAEALQADAQGKRFLLIRASRGREVLAEMLEAAGGEIAQVVVYQSDDVREPDADIATAMQAGSIDWTTATSSAIARSLVRLFGDSLSQTKLAAISPLTAGVLEEEGYAASVVATDFTAEGVIEAILKWQRNRDP